MCDCCGAPVADLIGLARSTGAKRCPPPPPSPFASPSVKCRVRGAGFIGGCVCARALSVHAVIGGTCLLAPSGSTHFLRRVSARALSVHAIQSVSIFPRPHATHPDRGRDEILLILPPIDPHPLVPTPCRQKMADSLFPQGRHMAWSSGARPSTQCEGKNRPRAARKVGFSTVILTMSTIKSARQVGPLHTPA